MVIYSETFESDNLPIAINQIHPCVPVDKFKEMGAANLQQF